MFTPYTEDDFEIATSYLSVDEADEIIAGQKMNTNWNNLDDDVKKILLIQSSLAVDGALMYYGVKVSDNQILKFPRKKIDDEDNKVIPLNIKFATASLCLKYSNDEAFKNVTSETISKLTRVFEASSNDIGLEILALLKPLKASTVRLGGMYDKY